MCVCVWVVSALGYTAEELERTGRDTCRLSGLPDLRRGQGHVAAFHSQIRKVCNRVTDNVLCMHACMHVDIHVGDVCVVYGRIKCVFPILGYH